jgi:hypothetical protein
VSVAKAGLQTDMALFDLIQSHRITAVIYVAAKLGVAECLRDGPLSSSVLSKAVGADENSLHRLLVALATIGVCNIDGQSRFSLTDIGAQLDSRSERSLKGWAIFEGELLSKSWTGLIESVRSGKTAAQLLGLNNSFDLMGRSSENVAVFNAAMADLTRIVTPGIIRAYNFSEAGLLMDVGGGSGELVSAVLQAFPTIKGIVFDLPRCAESANTLFRQTGISDRAEFIAGNFFDAVPKGADTILLKSVIHDWDDGRSAIILGNCREATHERGKLLLVERLMPAAPGNDGQHRSHAMSDLNMLRGPGGQERTASEYQELLNRNGFRLNAIFPAGLFSVIEACAF